jgi:hypothetical protein
VPYPTGLGSHACQRTRGTGELSVPERTIVARSTLVALTRRRLVATSHLHFSNLEQVPAQFRVTAQSSTNATHAAAFTARNSPFPTGVRAAKSASAVTSAANGAISAACDTASSTTSNPPGHRRRARPPPGYPARSASTRTRRVATSQGTARRHRDEARCKTGSGIVLGRKRRPPCTRRLVVVTDPQRPVRPPRATM